MMKSLLVVLLIGGVCAFPDGAPAEACEDMMPDHFLDPSPGGDERYSLSAEVNGDGNFDVTLSTKDGAPDFKGFFIQARSEGTGTGALGSWTFDEAIAKGRPCPEDSPEVNGLTHLNAAASRSEVTATFTGGADGLYFIASVVERFDLFYVNIRSEVIM